MGMIPRYSQAELEIARSMYVERLAKLIKLYKRRQDLQAAGADKAELARNLGEITWPESVMRSDLREFRDHGITEIGGIRVAGSIKEIRDGGPRPVGRSAGLPAHARKVPRGGRLAPPRGRPGRAAKRLARGHRLWRESLPDRVVEEGEDDARRRREEARKYGFDEPEES